MKRVLAAAFVLAVVLGGAGAALALRTPEPGPPTQVTVPPGTSTAGIADLLSSSGVIGFELGFRVLARAQGLDGRIQAGRYELNRGMGVRAALDALKRGPVEKVVAFTIPEGFTARQVAARVAQRTGVAPEDFTRAAAVVPLPEAFRASTVSSAEGFLFPDTYVVNENESAESIARRMVGLFGRRTRSLDFSFPASRGLSRYEALIVASLVEREAKVAEDRSKVAAVIYNRLAKRMRLQVDATVLYDLPEHKVPTKKDLERDTPYNTYLHEGLPPTPIANPGMAAIEAALRPADTRALYYVVIDPSGRHGFANTFDEFERMLKLRPPETRG